MSKITTTLLKKIFPGTPNSKLTRFVAPMNQILPKYGINNKKRFAAFIANVGIESDRLKALEEYASGAAYEGRVSLGNVRKGDGIRYKGRSILQTTGRYNYWKVVVAYLRVLTGRNWDSKLANSDFDAYLKTKEYSELLKEADKYNVNFLANPELLEVFPHAVEAAGVFVQDNNLNSYADKGQFFGYAGILNRGSAKQKALHYNERKDLYDLALRVIPDNFKLDGKEDLVERTLLSQPVLEDIGEPLSQNGVTISEEQGISAPPPSLVPVVTPVVEVEQVVAAADPPVETTPEESTWTKIGNKANAAYTAIASFAGGVIAWFNGASGTIILSVMGAVVILGGLYMIINWRRAENKDSKDRADKLAREKMELEAKLKREEMAYELQKLTLQSAMRKDLNTVRIVPPPTVMPNSDTPVE